MINSLDAFIYEAVVYNSAIECRKRDSSSRKRCVQCHRRQTAEQTLVRVLAPCAIFPCLHVYVSRNSSSRGSTARLNVEFCDFIKGTSGASYCFILLFIDAFNVRRYSGIHRVSKDVCYFKQYPLPIVCTPSAYT